MVMSIINNIRNKLKSFKKKRGDDPEAEAPEASSVPKAETQASESETEEAGMEPVRKKRPRRRRKRPNRKRQAPQAVPAPADSSDWVLSEFNVPVSEGKTRFHDLGLPDALMHAVSDLGFQYCSPIQARILPATLAGRDATGQAQTGTGKTAAFLITILHHFFRHPITEKRENGLPRVLILAPTRELVIQIAEEARLLSKYVGTRIAEVYGGMDYRKQRLELTEHPVDVVVATPGRLIDYCEHDDVRLDRLEILIIDEADRMMDMGFIPQVRRIVRKTPHKNQRQTLFFSATITGDVERLASQWTVDPVTVEIEPEKIEVDSVDQQVYLVTTKEKFPLLYYIITHNQLKRVIIFCNTRVETQRIADMLNRYQINCAVISGEIPQKKRLRTLENFRAGNIRVLVATDVAGRGLHIEGVSHVINYNIPHEPENYVHRIGRTGRAGATGTSVSFACESDSFYIPDIEAYLGHELQCTHPEEEWLILPPPPASSERPPRKMKKRRPPRNRNQNRGGRREQSGNQSPKRKRSTGKPPSSTA